MAQQDLGGLFTQKYQFVNNGVEVVIQNATQNYFRVHRGDGKGQGDHLSGGGNRGPFARWKVELMGGNLVKLKSTLTNKYYRITPNGHGFDAGGRGGKFCEFIFKKQGGGKVKLESNAHRGKYIAVDQKGDLKVGIGGGRCDLTFYRKPAQPPKPVQPQGGGDLFMKPYLFKKINTVCIQYPDNNRKTNGFLRANPNNKQVLDVNGKRGGPFTQFLAMPKNGNLCQFKSIQGGGYLRIQGGKIDLGGVANGPFTFFKVHQIGGGKVKLESNVGNLAGKYVAVQGQNNIAIGGGGKWTEMIVTRKN